MNALRFVAAFGVFLGHLKFWQAEPFYQVFLVRGHAGVTFFFLLSGFILAYRYADRLPSRDGGRAEALRRFYLARIARVYPVHLLTVALAVLLGGAERLGTGLVALGANIALLHSWVPLPGFLNAFNGPSWTLCHEAFFYALFPLLLPAVLRTGPIRLGFALMLPAAALVAFAVASPRDHVYLFTYFPPVRLFEFVIGIALFRLLGERLTTPAVGGFRDTLLELGCVGAVVLAVVLAPHVPVNLALSLWYVPVFATAIAVFACERGAVSRWFARPAWFHLGELSYSFYMLHLLMLVAVLGPLRPLGSFGVAFGAFALTLAASHLCYTWFEVPLRDRINGLAGRPATEQARAA